MMVTVNQQNILHRCGLEHAAQGKTTDAYKDSDSLNGHVTHS